MQLKFLPACKILFLAYFFSSATHHQRVFGTAIKPAGWLGTTFLFGVPALVSRVPIIEGIFGDKGLHGGAFSPCCSFCTLALMLGAALLGATLLICVRSWKRPPTTAAPLRPVARLGSGSGSSGFMYGGTWADLFAVAGVMVRSMERGDEAKVAVRCDL